MVNAAAVTAVKKVVRAVKIYPAAENLGLPLGKAVEGTVQIDAFAEYFRLAVGDIQRERQKGIEPRRLPRLFNIIIHQIFSLIL